MERVPYRWWAVGVAVVIVAGAAVWVTVSAIGPGEGSKGGRTDTCELSELDGPGPADELRAQAVSPSGEYVLGTADEDVIRWRDGEPEVIDGLRGATVINSDGMIAGDRGPGEPAWRHADGETTELAVPDEGEATVTGINDSGDVVGAARDLDAEGEVADGDPVSERGIPLLWPSGETEPVELEVAEGGLAWAETVAPDGTVLGYQVADGTDEPWPWRWSADGDGQKLPRPSGNSGDQVAVPIDVAGDWVLSTNAPDGYRWKLSEPDKAERVRLHSQSAIAIDAEGGAYGLAKWEVAGRQIGDEVQPLPRLADGGDAYGSGTTSVDAASDDGTVLAGSAGDEDGTVHAVTWNCG